MAKFPLVRLDEVYIDVPPSFNWGYTSGFFPRTKSIKMFNEKADILKAKAASGPVVLKMESTDDVVLEFEKIYLIGFTPHKNGIDTIVEIADRRFFLDYKSYVKDFNIKSLTGEKAVVDETLALVGGLGEIPTEFRPTFEFLPHSAKPRFGVKEQEPFLISEIVEDIFEFAKSELGIGWKYKDGEGIEEIFSEPERVVNNLPFAHNLKDAFGFLFSKLPGYNVYLDKLGDFVIYDEFSKKDIELLEGTGYPHQGRGEVFYIDSKYNRPSKIRVFFVRNHDIKAQFKRSETKVVPAEGIAAETITIDDPTLEHVTILPDISLKVGDKTFHRGQVKKFDDAFELWSKVPEKSPKISHEIVQREWHWGTLMKTYAELGEELEGIAGEGQIDWRGRVGAILRDYFQLFRLNQRFRARCLFMEGYHGAVVDEDTGFRSKSVAYTNYCLILSDRALTFHKDPELYKNVKEFKETLYGPKPPKPCPYADVEVGSVRDGLIRVSYSPKGVGHYKDVYPASLEGIPSYKIEDISKARFPDEKPKVAKGRKGEYGKLSGEHGLATVISCIPAPSGIETLHCVEISPEDLTDFFPSASEDFGEGVGPAYDVLIPAAERTAIYGWSDVKKLGILEAFGIFSGDTEEVGTLEKSKEISEKLADLLLNPEELLKTAKLKALEIWLGQFPNRYVGSKTVFMKDVEPVGQIGDIEKTVLVDGAMESVLQINDKIAPIDPMRFVPNSVRQFLTKQRKEV